MYSPYHLAKDLGEIQYNLILLELNGISDKDKNRKMQYYWNQFRAIVNLSSEHPEIMYSKYLPMLFAYQRLFRFDGGCVLQVENIDTNLDTSQIEKEIIEYLKKRPKECKNCK